MMHQMTANEFAFQFISNISCDIVIYRTSVSLHSFTFNSIIIFSTLYIAYGFQNNSLQFFISCFPTFHERGSQEQGFRRTWHAVSPNDVAYMESRVLLTNV